MTQQLLAYYWPLRIEGTKLEEAGPISLTDVSQDVFYIHAFKKLHILLLKRDIRDIERLRTNKLRVKPLRRWV